MTRVGVYAGSFLAFVAATAAVNASIYLPYWVSYSVTSVSGSRVYHTVGLQKSCTNVRDPPCRSFPQADTCVGEGEHFCSMWRTVSFLASLAAILHLATLVAFFVVINGGKQKRVAGWKVLSGMLLTVSFIEYAVIGLVAYLLDHDNQFLVPGWTLDRSWVMCTISASVSVLCAVGLVLSAYLLPPEAGYELLPDVTHS